MRKIELNQNIKGKLQEAKGGLKKMAGKEVEGQSDIIKGRLNQKMAGAKKKAKEELDKI